MQQQSDLYLIAGLGNPGADYRETRHNAGFMVADRLSRSGRNTGSMVTGRLARIVRGSVWQRKAQSLVCRLKRGRRRLVLAKPQTYMNRSGRAVQALLEIYPARLERLLVVYDDFALPLGKIRLRRGGSAGGQKGIRSIIEALGTDQIPRLRIGIAGRREVQDASDFVLSEFLPEEGPLLEEGLEKAAEACDTWLEEGIDQAMARFN
ncbi:MAG: aminoacyl-tRNA hydrolase [Acidobacteriota bacterium]